MQMGKAMQTLGILGSAQSSQTFHVEDVKFGQSMKPIYLKKKTKVLKFGCNHK
jgi:hypothetical protein